MCINTVCEFLCQGWCNLNIHQFHTNISNFPWGGFLWKYSCCTDNHTLSLYEWWSPVQRVLSLIEIIIIPKFIQVFYLRISIIPKSSLHIHILCHFRCIHRNITKTSFLCKVPSLLFIYHLFILDLCMFWILFNLILRILKFGSGSNRFSLYVQFPNFYHSVWQLSEHES